MAATAGRDGQQPGGQGRSGKTRKAHDGPSRGRRRRIDAVQFTAADRLHCTGQTCGFDAGFTKSKAAAWAAGQSRQVVGLPAVAAMRRKVGGARRDRTADLLHAMQALSQLSYGPVTLHRPRGCAAAHNLTCAEDQVSSSFSMPSPMISVTSSSPSSSSSMKVESSSARRPRPRYRRRRHPAFGLLALGLGVGILERDEFGGLGFDRLDLGLGDAAPRPWPPAGRASRDRSDRNHLAGIGRDHRILVQVIEFAARHRTDALGTELWLCHGRGFPEQTCEK